MLQPLVTGPTGEERLCTKCIHAPPFSKVVREHGSRGPCEFDSDHGSRRKTLAVQDLAEFVDKHIRENYQLGREEPYFEDDEDRPSYRQRGSSLLEIVSYLLEVEDEAVAAAVIAHLPDASPRDIAQGDEPFYDDFANYERISDVEDEERANQEEYWLENRIHYQWSDFSNIVSYQSRFFAAKGLLDNLFGMPAEYDSGPVAPIFNLPVEMRVFRARRLDDRLTEDSLGRDPGSQLGAPPRERAAPGRMNVEFIPAFYAAFSESTAVAELRPGIDEEVAVGEFLLQRELRVFDFTIFSRLSRQRPEAYAHTRYDFITQLEDEISRPVRAHERNSEYIPTQIVAEYLREVFQCEALIYRSSVMRTRSDETRNVVLLPRQEPFIGTGDSVLRFDRHSVKQIVNVEYKVFTRPF